MREILTTKGLLPAMALARQLIFEERPDQYVVSVRYYLPPTSPGLEPELVRAEAYPSPLVGPREDGCIETKRGWEPLAPLLRRAIFTETHLDYSIATEFYAPTDDGLEGELVKREVHVICKEPSVVATAIAASLG